MSEPSFPADSAGSSGEDEFAGIEPARPRKSPILAIVTVLLAGVLVQHLRADLQFAFAPQNPLVVGDIRTLGSRGVNLSDNSFVTISGQPDRRNSLYIEPRGEKDRQSFFRLLGSGDRLFVRALESDAANPQDRWTGRLRRFDAQPYADTLREHYGSLKVTRYFALEDFRVRLQNPVAAVHDRRGEVMTIEADREVALDLLSDEELIISMTKEKFPSEPDAKHELEQMKVDAKPNRETKDAFEYVIAAPLAERNGIIAQLDKREIPFALHDEQIRAPLGSIKLNGDVLTIGQRTIAWSKLRAAGMDAPIVIGHDAFVLTEGESPETVRWAPIIVGLLIAFAMFNLWYLLRKP